MMPLPMVVMLGLLAVLISFLVGLVLGETLGYKNGYGLGRLAGYLEAKNEKPGKKLVDDYTGSLNKRKGFWSGK